MKIKTYLLIIFLFGILLTSKTLAFSQLDVVINEISWMGTPLEGIAKREWWRYEWIELYNNKEIPVKLDSLELEIETEKEKIIIPLLGEIEPKGYFLLVSWPKIFNHYDLSYSNLKGLLKNSGVKLTLKEVNGKIIDFIDCREGWFAGNKKTFQTMERKNQNAPGNIPENWQTSLEKGGTPKRKNSLVKLAKNKENFLEKKELFNNRKSKLISLFFGIGFAFFSLIICYLLKRNFLKVEFYR